MDIRKPLEENTILNFPIMPCTIKSLLGKGSNAIAYLGEYPDLQQPTLTHLVLIKELFPFQEEELIYRKDDGSIYCDPSVEDELKLHRLSFERSSQVHLTIKHVQPGLVDENINTFNLNNTLYTVMGFSGGRTLAADMNGSEVHKRSLLSIVKRFQKILLELELFHLSGFLHLDISPDNILLIGNGKRERVSLIDYNSVHTLDEIRQANGIYLSAKRGYTAPEVLKGKVSQINACTDLYSVTAVFFYLLMNRTRTAYEMVDNKFQNLSDCNCLENQPVTVVSMVKTILQKGLSSLPRKRYQSISHMLEDVEELIDRIEGRGITHWALWESGYSEVKRIIQKNPAYHYLQDIDKLYPVFFQPQAKLPQELSDTSKQCSDTIDLEQMLSILYGETGNDERFFYIDGMGGMGKTTTLLRMVLCQKEHYLPEKPVFLYISLFNWNQSGTNYIRKRILENLLFKPETDSYDMANHELEELFSTPFFTKSGELPKAVLFLDGLNEASGDTTELLEEIEEFTRFQGVKIVLTGRTNAGFSNYSHYSLCPLEDTTVKTILLDNGILPPENASLFHVLKTPMMLSMFVQTVTNSKKQLFVDSETELLDHYLDSLVKKQTTKIAEDTFEYWAVDAAVYYILPHIAKLLSAENQAISNQELFSEIKRRYRDFQKRKRDLTKIYPRWIGHIHAILGNASNEDEWYDLIVHDILWRKLGLLVREDIYSDDAAISNGDTRIETTNNTPSYSYRLVHQILQDYMVNSCNEIDKALLKMKRQKMILPIAIAVILTGLQIRYDYISEINQTFFGAVTPFDKTLADQVLTQESTAYVMLLNQHEAILSLLNQLENGSAYDTSLTADFQWENSQSSIVSQTKFDIAVENLLATGDVMPWSKKTFDQESADSYISLVEARTTEYSEYIEMLEKIWLNDTIREKFGETYIQKFMAAVENDVYLNLIFFNTLIQPELDGMKEPDRDKWQQYQNLFKEYWEYKVDKDIPNISEVEMREIADTSWNELQNIIEKAKYFLEKGI